MRSRRRAIASRSARRTSTRLGRRRGSSASRSCSSAAARWRRFVHGERAPGAGCRPRAARDARGPARRRCSGTTRRQGSTPRPSDEFGSRRRPSRSAAAPMASATTLERASRVARGRRGCRSLRRSVSRPCAVDAAPAARRVVEPQRRSPRRCAQSDKRAAADALTKLERAPDAATRDAAHASPAPSSLIAERPQRRRPMRSARGDLAASGATPLVRRRAAELLAAH